MGLDVYMYRKPAAGTPADPAVPVDAWDCEGVELPSVKFPDHIFKVGYFRSSYNDAGMNSVLQQNLGTDLFEIFGFRRGEDAQEFVQWAAAKERAEAALARWRALPATFRCWPVRVANLRPQDGAQPSSDEAALALAQKELAVPHSFDAWSSAKGEFSREGMNVVAVVPGLSFMGPCVYLVTKSAPDPFYAQALEVVIETCDFALGQADGGAGLGLRWSG